MNLKVLKIRLGNVYVGGNSRVTVQSMANIDTIDTEKEKEAGEELIFLINFLTKNEMMIEEFMIPGASGIIEKNENGTDYILIQERYKENAEAEKGLIEIPAGKIRKFENIYDCLRREIWEETGLEVYEIEGEKDSIMYESNGYKVLNYTPFTSAQNVGDNYPIMIQTFICKARGEIISFTNETRNVKWVSLTELKEFLEKNEKAFYPMHVIELKKYLRLKIKHV